MDSKSNLIRKLWGDGNKLGALKIAAGFFDKSEETQIFKKGWGAHTNPSFYKQLGQCPETLIEAAYQCMQLKFKL